MARGSSTLGGSYHSKDSAGLNAGVTECSEFMSDQTVVDADFNESGANGFTRQVKGKQKHSSAKEKGKSFDICN